MNYYDVYYVEGCQDRELYQKMIRIAITMCDTLSLIYFKYKHNEKTTETAKSIKSALRKYAIKSEKVFQWPLTETRDYNHIYNMVTYTIPRDFNVESVFDIVSVFDMVQTLWDWDYPEYPMDPCFYRNGKVFFATCTHEHINELYLNSEGDYFSVKDIESIGVKLYHQGRIPEEQLFHLGAGN